MSGYWKDGEPNWRRMEAMARRGWGRFAAGVLPLRGEVRHALQRLQTVVEGHAKRAG